MIRLLLTSIIIIKSLSLNAQDKNEFLDREFWKSDPSVSLIKKTIEDKQESKNQKGGGYSYLKKKKYKSTKKSTTKKSNTKSTKKSTKKSNTKSTKKSNTKSTKKK